MSSTTESFLAFLRKRSSKGMEIDHLSIRFKESTIISAGYDVVSQLADILAVCSATLQHLTLSISKLAEFHLPIQPSSITLLSAVCACKQLRALVLWTLLEDETIQSESRLLQRFVASLPELRVLLFYKGIHTEGVLGNIFRNDITSEVAAKREPGLQLLMMDICDTMENFALPKTLCHLFLSNRDKLCHIQPHQMLECLPNLEELYLVGFYGRQFEVGESDTPLSRTFEKLRIAVVDILYDPTVTAELLNTALPSLELLALPGMIPYCATIRSGKRGHTPVKLKCPNLREVIFNLQDEKDIPLLEHLLSGGAPRLETIQVAVDYEMQDVDTFDTFYCLWEVLARSNSLRNLKIIFQNYDDRYMDQQVQTALCMLDPMCLPSLETFELYSFTTDEGAPASFELGSALAHQQGARGVCNVIGQLVARGALPSLKKVGLYPGMDSYTGNPVVGPGPQLDDALHVKSSFLPEPYGWDYDELSWIRPSHLDAELQRRVLAALTRPLDLEREFMDEPPYREAAGFAQPNSFDCLIS
ncbi:hypothetical protein COCOBI_17-2730 [Coccomyxa sp. Obi]|nr:hypothetical protein COCOBI_17-2730 [Coccomyxa sp. Obi]